MTTVQQLALSKTPCIRDHMIPGVHVDGCTDTTCTGCQPAEAARGRLCLRCYSTLRYNLHASLPIMTHALNQRYRSIPAFNYDAVRVSGGNGPARLPINDVAIEMTDSFYADLANYVTDHARKIHQAPPPSVFRALERDRNITGFTSGASLAEAYNLTLWLVQWELAYSLDIAALPEVGVWWADLSEMLRTLRGRFPIEKPKPRPSRLACRRDGIGCGHGPVNVTYDAKTDDFTVECDTCGWQPADGYVYAAEAV